MLVGAVHGYRGLIRELIREVKGELGVRRCPVVATGGYARVDGARSAGDRLGGSQPHSRWPAALRVWLAADRPFLTGAVLTHEPANASASTS
jgi:hypothetical protein